MWKTLLAGVAAFLAAGTFAVGAGGAGNDGSTSFFTEDIAFTLSPAVCDDITSEVTGEGTIFVKVHESVDARGAVHFSLTQVAHGTAADDAGGTYTFNYHQTQSSTFAGFPVELSLTDHFQLVGNGGANRVHTFFTAMIIFESPADPGTFVPGVVHGDPEHCDPI